MHNEAQRDRQLLFDLGYQTLIWNLTNWNGDIGRVSKGSNRSTSHGAGKIWKVIKRSIFVFGDTSTRVGNLVDPQPIATGLSIVWDDLAVPKVGELPAPIYVGIVIFFCVCWTLCPRRTHRNIQLGVPAIECCCVVFDEFPAHGIPIVFDVDR